MKRFFVFLSLLVLMMTSLAAQAHDVAVEVKESGDGKIDFLINGEVYNTYFYGKQWVKPFLAPLKTAQGTRITRSVPAEKIDGKEADHPHHTGLFFGYGDTNNHDFWAMSREGAKAVHNRVVSTDKKRNRASLTTELNWLDPNGQPIVRQTQTIELRAGRRDARILDVSEELTAVAPEVVFEDSKEGQFALRLRDELTEKQGARYTNAEGAELEKGVWGRRSKYVVLKGSVNGEKVSLAIFDHPSSFNHPTYWHARGYGLFALNPFGRKDFEKGAEPMNHKIKQGESVRFKHRVLIYSGDLSKEQLEEEYSRYLRAVR